MNMKINEFKSKMRGRKVAVLGIGISNTPLIKYLALMGADITAFDKNDREKLEPEIKEFEGLNIKYSLGKDYLSGLKGFDTVFRTPGMRYDLPELLSAKEDGSEITSEMEVFFELCPAEIFAVTGSDGKTTTTTLIYNILKEQGYSCWLGGNIGTPLLSRVEEIKETDKVVVELSSFQLHTMKQSPQVAVVTNLSPNHLDIHKSMEEYIDAKKNIFLYQPAETSFGRTKLIVNYDNSITKGFASEASGDAVFFSRVNSLEEGAVLEDGMLAWKKDGRKTDIVKADDVALMGDHNIENYLAVIAAVIGHVQPDAIRKVITTFAGVEHRVEPVRELNGVKFYNDSIGSSPTRTIANLKAFNQKVILIAGGYDKKIPYDDLGPIMVEKVKCLVLLGQTAPKIEKALRDEIEHTGMGRDIKVINCNSLEESVTKAYSVAEKGDIVILSPASASFGMFKNFEERGLKFKELVMGLK